MSALITAKDWISEGNFYTLKEGHRIFYRRSGIGPTLVMLHGFPTWSYDYAELFEELKSEYDVITFDFLGYGLSDKPKDFNFTVKSSADTVEEILQHLNVSNFHLVIHDYGAIVGQELLFRINTSQVKFKIDAISLMNCGIVYATYRPTLTQKILAIPFLGKLVSSLIKEKKVLNGLNAVRGKKKLNDIEFKELAYGIFINNGHKLAYRLIKYNVERAKYSNRWEESLQLYNGPLQLIWGLDDPVSGKHTLNEARLKYRNASVIELAGVGHFPQSESPFEVAQAIRSLKT